MHRNGISREEGTQEFPDSRHFLGVLLHFPDLSSWIQGWTQPWLKSLGTKPSRNILACKPPPPENKAQPIWARTPQKRGKTGQIILEPNKNRVWAPQTPADPPKPCSRAGFYREQLTEVTTRRRNWDFLPALGSTGAQESLPEAPELSLGTEQGQVEVSICASCASQLPCSQSFVLFSSTKRQNKQVRHDFTLLCTRICLQEKPPKATRFPFYLPLLSLLIFSGEK